MVAELIQLVKKKNELKRIKETIQNMSEEEKSNINQVINYAITWWLKDIGPDSSNINAEDASIDDLYDLIKKTPLRNEDIAKLDKFQKLLGLAILEGLLKKEDAIVELHCGYHPEDILESCIYKSDCDFLNLRLPIKARMEITRKTVSLKEGHTNKLRLALDVAKGPVTADDIRKKYANVENGDEAMESYLVDLLFGNEYVTPYTFNLTNFNFFEGNCQQLVDNMSSRIKIRKN